MIFVKILALFLVCKQFCIFTGLDQKSLKYDLNTGKFMITRDALIDTKVKMFVISAKFIKVIFKVI